MKTTRRFRNEQIVDDLFFELVPTGRFTDTIVLLLIKAKVKRNRLEVADESFVCNKLALLTESFPKQRERKRDHCVTLGRTKDSRGFQENVVAAAGRWVYTPGYGNISPIQ